MPGRIRTSSNEKAGDDGRNPSKRWSNHQGALVASPYPPRGGDAWFPQGGCPADHRSAQSYKPRNDLGAMAPKGEGIPLPTIFASVLKAGH
jgi:hypothetical protein